MSVAKDKVAEAVKLLLQEEVNRENGEFEIALRDFVFKAVANDSALRSEILSIVTESDVGRLMTELTGQKTDIATTKGLLESALGEITRLKETVRYLKKPWWKKVFSFYQR